MHRIDHPYAEARRIYSSIEQTLPACCVCPWHETKILCRHTFLAHLVGHHNHHGGSQQQRHPDGDKDVIGKAIEEF